MPNGFYTAFFPAGADVGNQAPGLDRIPAVVAFTKRYGAYVTADLDTCATIAEVGQARGREVVLRHAGDGLPRSRRSHRLAFGRLRRTCRDG
jgi:hypothetical protein